MIDWRPRSSRIGRRRSLVTDRTEDGRGDRLEASLVADRTEVSLVADRTEDGWGDRLEGIPRHGLGRETAGVIAQRHRSWRAR